MFGWRWFTVAVGLLSCCVVSKERWGVKSLRWGQVAKMELIRGDGNCRWRLFLILVTKRSRHGAGSADDGNDDAKAWDDYADGGGDATGGGGRADTNRFIGVYHPCQQKDWRWRAITAATTITTMATAAAVVSWQVNYILRLDHV